MKKSIFKINIFIFLILLISCRNDINKNIVESVNNEITAIATIEIPRENLYYITPAMDGIVGKTYISSGEIVKKGDIICSLYNPIYLDIQKEYLSLKYKLEYLKEEFKRQGNLTVENYSSIKKMQKAQSEYLAIESACFALEKKLSLIGYNPNKLLKKGPVRYAHFYAPANGKLILNDLVPGKFLKQGSLQNYVVLKDTLSVLLEIEKQSFYNLPEKGIFELYFGKSVICEVKYHLKDQQFNNKNNNKIIVIAKLDSNVSILQKGMKLKAILKK